MLASRTMPRPNIHAPAGMAWARFVQNALAAVSFPGAGLPRGYFCSVTPP